MKTKFKNVSVIACAVLVAIPCFVSGITGCRSLNPATGQQEFDPVKTEQVKAALQPVVSGGIRRVILSSKNTNDAVQVANYLRAVGSVFCQMDTNGNFSVDFLLAEVDKFTAPAIRDSYVTDIKNAIIALYRINFADRFRAELPPDKWPRQVASLFCESIDRGLKDAGQPGLK